MVMLTSNTHVLVPNEDGRYSDDWGARYDKWSLEQYIRDLVADELRREREAE